VARKRDQTQKIRQGFGKIPCIRAFKARPLYHSASRDLERESMRREASSRSTVPLEGVPSSVASPSRDGPPLPSGGRLCPSADACSRDRPHPLLSVPRTRTSSPPLRGLLSASCLLEWSSVARWHCSEAQMSRSRRTQMDMAMDLVITSYRRRKLSSSHYEGAKNF
jgi:hypothetical protein